MCCRRSRIGECCTAQNIVPTFSIADSAFDGNSAQTSGGGWSHAAGTIVMMQDTVFANNIASVSKPLTSCCLRLVIGAVILAYHVARCNDVCTDSGGGALLNTWGTATINNVTFTNNQAQGTAGALLLTHCLSAATTFVFCGGLMSHGGSAGTAGAISSAPQAGGIGFVSGTAASINACHFSGNSAAANGGSLYAFGCASK